MNDWIDIKNEIPKPNQYCLLKTDEDLIVNCRRFGAYGFYHGKTPGKNGKHIFRCITYFGFVQDFKRVSHWKPMPDLGNTVSFELPKVKNE